MVHGLGNHYGLLRFAAERKLNIPSSTVERGEETSSAPSVLQLALSEDATSLQVAEEPSSRTAHDQGLMDISSARHRLLPFLNETRGSSLSAGIVMAVGVAVIGGQSFPALRERWWACRY